MSLFKIKTIKIYLYGLPLIFLLITGCATVGVNNYQNAETLGKKRFKTGLAMDGGKEMSVGFKITEGTIEIAEDNLSANDFMMLSLGLTGQLGITRSTDIGFALNVTISSASGKFYLKQNLVHTPGHFAIAFIPGIGIYTGKDTVSFQLFPEPDTEYDKENSFAGYYFDIPLIISKRWSNFSIHLSPKYMYHRLNVSTDYRQIRESDGEVLVHNTDEETFYFHSYGIAVGFSLVYERVELTPEISFLRVKDLSTDSYRWTFYPGLGIYVKFGSKKTSGK
jgi:hypothetical protein